MKHLKRSQVHDFLQENPDAVLIDCRSEQRSVDAGIALEQAGFTDVINVLDGFEGPLDEHHPRSKVSGWRKEGQPWEQT